ncbi:unnamed protein product [Periconia digitata]|uniref:Uncharacterized protein n=1 Tax=Periconia digitata TaxID=1303443 RepID=A0A9W4U1Y8_9PLEO|nr:unnamed protein product [Periconia digitata]
MPGQPEGSTSTFKAATSATSTSTSSAPKKNPNRKFFHNIQPSFAVSQPSTQRIRFLDNADPKKNIVVRKNAREWVHRNKQVHVLDVRTKRPDNNAQSKREVDKILEPRKKSQGLWRIVTVSDPLLDVAASKPDPFDVFPAVGRKIDHIIEYFLTSCPEEIPCSDDKYAWRPQAPHLQLSRENTVLGNMAEEYVSFVLWLYATTMIRDGTVGTSITEETMYYYRLSLEAIQKALNNTDAGFGDPLICALGCFTACAVFGGMFEAAQMHCDALCKTITLRGKGDMAKGFLACNSFTRKASQWCEFGVAAYNRAVPRLPYLPPAENTSLPYDMVVQSDRLANMTFANIPLVSLPMQNVVRMLHQLAITQAQHHVIKQKALGRAKTDSVSLRLLYDAEYILLQMLSSQSTPDHTFSPVDVMLTEACQLFIWLGPRDLPYEMKLCNRFVLHLKDALVQVLRSADSPEATTMNSTTTPVGQSLPTPGIVSASYAIRPLRARQNAILWALYLGTITSGVGPRPEYEWYSRNFRAHTQAMGLKTLQDVDRQLKLFPSAAHYRWSDIRKLEPLIGQ